MRWLLLLIALVLASGCKKKQDRQAGPKPSVEPPSVTVVPVPPISPAKSGPAYFLMGNMIVRYHTDGWERLDRVDSAIGLRFAPAIDGSVVVYGSSVWRLADKLVELPGLVNPTAVVVGADATIWAIGDDKLFRAPAGEFLGEALPTEDPPRGVAVARDKAVWVHTLDRTYVRAGTTWKPVDVASVTGQVADILRIAAHPRGDLYLLTTIGLFRRENDAWTAMHTGSERELSWITPGPEGRFALALKNGALLLGDARGVRQFQQPNRRFNVIDGNGRLWLVDHEGIRVTDLNGTQLRLWRGDETPAGQASGIGDVYVVEGSPSIKIGERASGKVTGRIEGSASGVTVIACTSTGRQYGKEPCQGVDNTRTTTTTNGRFTLDDVAVAPMRLWIKRGEWRDTEHAPCCEALRPDGTLDIGTLRLR